MCNNALQEALQKLNTEGIKPAIKENKKPASKKPIKESFQQDIDPLKIVAKIYDSFFKKVSPAELFIYSVSSDLGWAFDDKLNALDDLDQFYTDNYDTMEDYVYKKVEMAIDNVAKEFGIKLETMIDLIELIDIRGRMEKEGKDEDFKKLYDLIPKNELV